MARFGKLNVINNGIIYPRKQVLNSPKADFEGNVGKALLLRMRKNLERNGDFKCLINGSGGRVFAVLAGHRDHDPGEAALGLLVVVVDGLADVVPQRHVVLGLAGDLATVAPEAAADVDDPAELLAVVGRLHALPPVFLLEE